MSYEGASHVYSLKIINYTNILFWQNLEIEVTYANPPQPPPPPPPPPPPTPPTHTAHANLVHRRWRILDLGNTLRPTPPACLQLCIAASSQGEIIYWYLYSNKIVFISGNMLLLLQILRYKYQTWSQEPLTQASDRFFTDRSQGLRRRFKGVTSGLGPNYFC